jgi:hypothetical protein
VPASSTGAVRRAIRASTGIDGRATAVRAVGLALIVCPAEPDEDCITDASASVREAEVKGNAEP